MISRYSPAKHSQLTIPAGELQRVMVHAEHEYPKECCGILMGHCDGRKAAVTGIVQSENGRQDRAGERYEIPPEDLLDAMRREGKTGETVVGFYHSHPDRPAVPSSIDEQAAWPGVSYVIVAVSDGRAGNVRSWRRSDDGLEEERLVLEGAEQCRAEAK